MTNEELKQYRIQLFRDASMMKKAPERTPHFSSFGLWRSIHMGQNIEDALNDYDLMGQSVIWFAENFKFDGMTNFGTRNPVRIPNAIGKSVYVVDPENEMLSVEAYELCKTEELPEFIEDPDRFCWEKLLPRRYPAFNPEMRAETMQKALDEMFAFTGYSASIGKKMREEYAFPPFTPSTVGYVLLGVEFLFGMVRGIKGFSLDMRRNPQLIKAACDAYDDRYLTPILDKLVSLPEGPDMSACFDFGVTLLAHNVMNRKQWDQIYWPTVKRICDAVESKKKTCRITIEGNIDRFADCLRDYSDGTLTLALEQDDIFTMKDVLPNCAMMGGMSTEYLGKRTKEECLDLAKRLIDEVGPWYIMNQDKFPTYRNDAQPENLKAVCDFVQSYKPQW